MNEHSQNPVERMKYKSFLKMAIDRVQASIKEMEEWEETYLRKETNEFTKLDNDISRTMDGIKKSEIEYMLPIEREYLKKLKNKHANYKTHLQREIHLR